MKTTSKKNKKNEDDLQKKSTLNGCDIIVNLPSILSMTEVKLMLFDKNLHIFCIFLKKRRQLYFWLSCQLSFFTTSETFLLCPLSSSVRGAFS